MDKPLSAWDRTVYGAISAIFGVLFGLGSCLCIFVAFDGSPPVRWIVLTSAIYFFVVGVVRGQDAALFMGEALTTVAAAALAETGAVTGASRGSKRRFGSLSSPVLLLIWVTIIGLLAWRA